MSDNIIDRQIEILEEKLRDLRSQKYDVVVNQKYEEAARLRDAERETMETLNEKDPGNEMVMEDNYFLDKFIRKGKKLDYIQELASEGKITVKYTIKLTSMIEYSERMVDEICEKYGLSKKEWLVLCKEYNKVNDEQKVFSIDPEGGGTMKNYEIAVNPLTKVE